MANNYCGICGRALDNPASVRRGIGPDCLANLKLGALKTDDNQNRYIIEPIFNFRNDLVWRQVGDGLAVNVPQVTVWHSPTGFGIGYSGSGPADLALNICELFLPHRPLTAKELRRGQIKPPSSKLIDEEYERQPVHCWREWYASRFAVRVHQDFKFEFLAGKGASANREAGQISGPVIREWLQDRLNALIIMDAATSDLVPQALNDPAHRVIGDIAFPVGPRGLDS